MQILVQTSTGYDLKANVHRYLTFLRSKTGAVTDEHSRLLKAQADMQELKVRLRTGEVVSRAAVERETFAMVRRMRDNLENIPDRVAGICAAEQDQFNIHAILAKEIRQTLEELSHAPDQRPTSSAE